MKAQKSTIIILIFFLFLSHLKAQWVQKNFPTDENLFKVKFAEQNVGWIIGANHIYKTTDGGDNWVAKASTSGGFGKALYCSGNDVAIYSDEGNGGIFKTSDGGDTWNRVDTSKTKYRDIEFIDANTGFIVGGNDYGNKNAIVKKTTDGGETWEIVFQKYLGEQGYFFNSISSIGSEYLWVLSYQGYVHHSTNGGLDWSFQDSIGRSSAFQVLPLLFDLQFTDANKGVAVGGTSSLSIIQGTDNGGTDWNFWIIPDQSGVITSSFQEAQMINSDIGWVVGQYYTGSICATTDGGTNWITQGPEGIYNSIYMLDQNTGWIVGKRGVVLKTTNGGGTTVNVENEKITVKGFNLYQNYPNPFNPSTTIEFNLPEESIVKLSIYNLIGQEIEVIINDQLKAGKNKIKWNAKNYPSGIYFYKIESGSFTETKSMTLIK